MIKRLLSGILIAVLLLILPVCNAYAKTTYSNSASFYFTFEEDNENTYESDGSIISPKTDDFYYWIITGLSQISGLLMICAVIKLRRSV